MKQHNGALPERKVLRYESKTAPRIRWRRRCQPAAELEEKEYTATAGGDAVKAVVTGKMEVKSVEIKPEVIDPEDAEMLGDLVTAAVNEALRAASQEKEERMSALSGGMNIPGLF